MKTYFILFLLTVSALFSQAQNYTLKELWRTDAIFEVPESVIYDQQNEQIIVANINGSPSDKDNNGYLSLLNLDGSIKNLKWVEGLNAPKGMAIYQNKLYVSDIDQLVLIDIQTAQMTNRYPNSKSVFLNDVCVNTDGDVFVSDSQISTIFKLENDKLVKWLEHPLLNRTNGIYAKEDVLLLGNKDLVNTVNYLTKEVQKYIEGTGSIDGLEWVEGDTYIISDWSGAMHLIRPGEKKIKISDTSADGINAADIGFIKEKKIVLVPTFFDNRIFAYQLTETEE